MKRRLLRLVLTVRNLVNFIECQKTKQRECPVGVLYTYLKYLYSHWCIHISLATIGIEVVLYISAWGLCVARFDR